MDQETLRAPRCKSVSKYRMALKVIKVDGQGMGVSLILELLGPFLKIDRNQMKLSIEGYRNI